jgi:CBS domain-containing protein
MSTTTPTTSVTALPNDNMFDSTLLRLLHRPVEEVRPRKHNRTATVPETEGAVCVQQNDSLASAFDKMNAENIQAAPVIISASQKRYCGIISLTDIAYWLMQEMNLTNDAGEIAKKFKTTSVKTILSPRYSHPVPQSYSMLHVMELIASQELGRVTVLDNLQDQRVTGIITASMLVGVLYNELKQSGGEFLAACKTVKVADVLTTNYCCTIQQGRLALEAFESMRAKHVGALAVVDDRTHRLIDVISIRDLKGIAAAHFFTRLTGDVVTFKAKSRIATSGVSDGSGMIGKQPPIFVQCVTMQDDLADVITLMEEKQIHRVFVVNSLEGMLPVGVITAHQVLRVILPTARPQQLLLRQQLVKKIGEEMDVDPEVTAGGTQLTGSKFSTAVDAQ